MHIMDTLLEIKKRGMAILLVEQNAAESLRELTVAMSSRREGRLAGTPEPDAG